MAHLLAVKDFTNFKFISKYYEGKVLLKDLIIKSLKSKKYFIEKDEFDKKERKLLNFGHTFLDMQLKVQQLQVPGMEFMYMVV